MRTIFLLGIIFLSYIYTFAQAPESFKYQAIARVPSGLVLPNQNVGFKISLIQGTTTGSAVYSEEHNLNTNSFGLVNLEIGNGTNPIGIFANINWNAGPFFIKIEFDATGGNTYADMGTTQLLSVPYALFAASGNPGPQGLQGIQGPQGNTGLDGKTIINGTLNPTTQGVDGDFYINTSTATLFGPKISGIWGAGTSLIGPAGTYTSGTGINITGSVISNTAPDQTIILSNGTGISVTGTYPNFTITNSSPNQSVSLTGTGATSVTGLYPNFTISSTDNNTTYSAGSGININGSNQVINTAPDQTISVTGSGSTTVTGSYPNFIINSTDNNTTYSAGSGININGSNQIINSAPDQTMSLTGNGATTVTGTYPNFTISSSDNNTTYSAGTGLTLTGTTFNSKWTTFGNNIYNNNTGFVGIGTSIPTSTLHINGSLRISDDTEGSGKVLTSDLFGNASWQFLTAIPTFTGTPNFIPKFNSTTSIGNSIVYETGNKIGVGTTTPSGKFEIQAELTSNPEDILFQIKDKNGYPIMQVYQDSIHFYINDPGIAKTANRGSFAVSGKSDTKAFTSNYFHLNTVNLLSGKDAGYKLSSGLNYSGKYNTFLGYEAGYNDTSGYKNYFIGYRAGYSTSSGYSNIFIGDSAGLSNTIGNKNIFIGNQSGFFNTTGYCNLFLGRQSGYSNIDGIYNQFLGYQSGYSNTSGGHNNFIGYKAGYSNTTGWTNIFIGGYSGYDNLSGTQNVFLGSSTGTNNTTGFNNVYIGHNSGLTSTTGSGNIFIGFESGKTETGSDKLFIENSSTTSSPLIHGDFANDRIAFHRLATLYPLQVGWNITNGNGAYLTAGGTWTSTSSKSLKNRFTDLDRSDLLSKIETMEIKGWFYKETQEYHIGPFAEDFYMAFGTGVLDESVMLGKSLAAGDVAGVSLAAVKELIILNRFMQKQIEDLKAEIETLKASIGGNK